QMRRAHSAQPPKSRPKPRHDPYSPPTSECVKFIGSGVEWVENTACGNASRYRRLRRASLVMLSRLKSEINCWSKIASLVYLRSMTEPTSESLKHAQSSQFCCPIVELRQYTLHPGKRDVLIDLFEREFIETQEAVGSKVIGQ